MVRGHYRSLFCSVLPDFPGLSDALGNHHSFANSYEIHKIDTVSQLFFRRKIVTSKIEIFHEQLPLPVPCYDLLPVTDLTVGHREGGLRVLPAPLS
jgi:hypothetical protein